jgi:hypothetical protein
MQPRTHFRRRNLQAPHGAPLLMDTVVCDDDALLTPAAAGSLVVLPRGAAAAGEDPGPLVLALAELLAAVSSAFNPEPLSPLSRRSEDSTRFLPVAGASPSLVDLSSPRFCSR